MPMAFETEAPRDIGTTCEADDAARHGANRTGDNHAGQRTAGPIDEPLLRS